MFKIHIVKNILWNERNLFDIVNCFMRNEIPCKQISTLCIIYIYNFTGMRKMLWFCQDRSENHDKDVD